MTTTTKTTKRKIEPRMPAFHVRMPGVHFIVRLPERLNKWMELYLKASDYQVAAELARELLQERKTKDKTERGKMEIEKWLERYVEEEDYSSPAELVRELLRNRRQEVEAKAAKKSS